MPTKVLIIDDEPALRDMLSFALIKAHMQPKSAADANAALLAISDEKPDIILMDWMMPGISGLELTRRLRNDSRTSDIPIIMLTARANEDSRVTGLDAGSDDYVSKPFSARELIARIKAVLRRATAADENGCLTCGPLQLNTASRQVTCDNIELHLGPTEFKMLEFFMSHPGRAYQRSQLLDQIWGNNVYIDERTVDVHIRRLRKALQMVNMDKLIQTVRGHGYRFQAKSRN